jgi:hypothetical protein
MFINVDFYEGIVVNHYTNITVVILIAYHVIVNLIFYMDDFDLMVWILIGIDVGFDVIYDLIH